jgi:putative ABC transport system ATP-binding protein
MKKHTPSIEFSKVTFSFSDTRVLFDNLSFKNNRDRIPPDDTALKAQLENFLLSDLSLETNAQTLSVGQLQRLCLIRGLMLDPKVVLLDEPASALDEKSSRIVEETAECLCAESGLTVLMVSQRKFEPKRVKCNSLQIANGRVKAYK